MKPFALRPYQVDCHDSVFKEWEDNQSTLGVLPTGGGKTLIFASIIKSAQPKRAMVLAHREELIFQARDKITSTTGLECAIEMADSFVNNSMFGDVPVVISTVQTQSSRWGDRRRMGRFNPAEFGVLIIDECFPSGTRIDDRYIDDIKIGDRIRTHNGYGSVTRVFKKPVTSMCLISLLDGQILSCTPNHPIWTQDGFKSAIDLTQKDVVVSIIDYELMPYLQNRNPIREEAVFDPSMQVLLEQGHYTKNIQQEWRPDNQVQENQRDARPGCEGQGFNQVESHGVETCDQKRKWTWAYDPRAGFSSGAWVAMQCDSENADGQTQWISELLQTGCWKFQFEDWGRSGRILTLLTGEEEAGFQKGGLLEFKRVDSVKVYEPSDRESIKYLCPDGFVYNLEVSNGHTYFAEGILVHNCHHATANSYRDIINYYTQNKDLKVLGVTATPDRTDEQALGQVFQTVAFDYEILDLIQDGWLVPVDQQFVSISGLDFSEMRTTCGDLNGADLTAVMESEKNLQGVAGSLIQIIGNRRTIVFTAGVKQAEMLSSIFNRHRVGMSNWVCGTTPKDQRRDMLDKFQHNGIQVICNCGVLTEGYDNSGVEVIGMARPTKSRALYAQMAGRGTRALPGIVDTLDTPEARREAIARSAKPSVLIVDFVGNSGKHKLMSSADILGGKISDAACARAVILAKKSGQAVRMDAALEEAQEELIEEARAARAREELRKSKVVAKVSFTTKSISPFDIYDIVPAKPRGWDEGKSLSEKQRLLLRKHMAVDPDTLSYGEGRQLISEQFRRWDLKLCTFKQARVLKRYGYETKDMKMEEASRIMDELARNGWKKQQQQTQHRSLLLHQDENL